MCTEFGGCTTGDEMPSKCSIEEKQWNAVSNFTGNQLEYRTER